MRKAIIAAAAAAIALAPFSVLASARASTAPAPLTSAGDQCMNWHATTQDGSGRTLTCTHTFNSGHLMYWEYGGSQDG